jgi:hypothetical protein
MFDLTLQIGHVEVVPNDDHIVINMHPVMLLPVGNGQAMPVPCGIVRVPMAKDAAATHAEAILDVVEGNEGEAPKPQSKSDLVIANSMQGVDKVADQAKKFRGQ